jgi:hypothetical protein
MINLARYSYAGGSSSGLSGGSGDNSGAGYSNASDSAAVAASTVVKTEVVQETNKTVISFNSADRDALYPDASDCTLPVPDNIVNVKSVRISGAEIPHSDYIISGARLYISEYQNGIWQPFYTSISSGNYSIDQLVDALDFSFTACVAIGSQNATLMNTYNINASTAWGRIALRSNQVVDYTLHFRASNVIISKASVLTVNSVVDRSRIRLNIADAQSRPLTRGAACTMFLGGRFSAQTIVVEEVIGTGSELIVRCCPSVKGLQSTPVAGSLRPARITQYNDFGSIIDSLIGPVVSGSIIPISTSANLEPFSKPLASADDIALIMGFSNRRDLSPPEFGTQKILGIQGPFARSDGFITVSTELPHFAMAGDVISITDSRTSFDNGWLQVSDVQDATHLTLKPLSQQFIDYSSYVDTDGNTVSLHFFSKWDSAPLIRPLEWLIPTAPTLVSAGNNMAVLNYTVSSGYTFDTNDYIGREVVFDAGDFDSIIHPGFEFQYARGTILSFQQLGGVNYFNEVTIEMVYPSWLLPGQNAKLTLVGKGQDTTFDPMGAYTPCLNFAPSRYDLSLKSRYVYIALFLDSMAVGNLQVTSFPGSVLFARLPLLSGADALTFLGKDLLDGYFKLDNPIARLRSIRIKVFNTSGKLYQFRGVDYSLLLQFETSTK